MTANAPRVEIDTFVVYPTCFEDIGFDDRSNWCLIVQNGHAWGWSVRPGPPGTSGSHQAMNRKGKWIFESRGDRRNKTRRFTVAEALKIAVKYVDTHTVVGLTASQAAAKYPATPTVEPISDVDV
jgi:protein involved in polysaccharide export with SLBB domain